MISRLKHIALVLFLAVVVSGSGLYAQFYRGTDMEFGKNRLQFFEPNWQHMDFPFYNLYFYGPGRELAVFTAIEAQKTIRRLEKLLEYRMNQKVYILVFNTYDDFKQSNIGLETSEGNNVGGTTHIQGNRLFVYFTGDHNEFRKQIRGGLTEVILKEMLFGSNWRETVKNSALMSIPEWYVNGLTSYATERWSIEFDDNLRDLVLGGKMEKFNRLTGSEATFVGHALWYYISEVYGPDVIPNIVYMSKISRSIESGFLFVIGMSLEDVIADAREFYLNKYEADDRMREMPPEDPLPIKTKKTRSYHRPTISPDGNMLVYNSSELGQYKVWLYDISRNKTKRILRGDFKLDRIADKSNPIFAWHPSGDFITIIYNHKGKKMLMLYDVKKGKKEKRELRRVEKVLSVNYSMDGRKLVFSAINKGQSDIFVYNLATSSIRQVTNDIYDDLYPSFIPKTNEIMFSSNRMSDSVKVKDDFNMISDQTDIFVYDYMKKPPVYKRLVNTQAYSEIMPYSISPDMFAFLSGENGIVNRYVGTIDSTISQIDTVIHYRYFTKTRPVTNYKRNILWQSISLESETFSELIKLEGKYLFYKESFSDVKEKAPLVETSYRQSMTKQIKARNRNDLNEVIQARIVKPASRLLRVINDTTTVDIDNYAFGNEERGPAKRKPQTNSKLVKLKTASDKALYATGDKTEEDGNIKLPRQENYRRAFRATDIITQFDFNFANQIYQPFNGGPYVNPGMGTVLKVAVFDLMEDLKIEGGVRFGFNGSGSEYFISYLDRRKRLDKELSFQYQTLKQRFENFVEVKSAIYQIKGAVSYPFNDVLGLKTTLSYRFDRNTVQAQDPVTLAFDDGLFHWAGLKAELIFDDTRNRGLNLYNGSRGKLFGEAYFDISSNMADIYIVGIDFRNYKRIHRNIIWANRWAGSTSFGSRKLVYYLGSVDNWIIFGNQPRFNFDQNIAYDQNYYWQALATPLRGFNQNIRNGNSFVVWNSEIRFPVFAYFIKKPIKSKFIENFQIIGFGDIGTAWTGPDPYSDENAFNTRTIDTEGGNITVRLRNKKDPFVGALGFGLRTKLLGYFVRFDYAWGIEDGLFRKPMAHFSLGLDF